MIFPQNFTHCYLYINISQILRTFLYLCFLLAKLVPVGYGIKKLQISAVIEDDKVKLCSSISFQYRQFSKTLKQNHFAIRLHFAVMVREHFLSLQGSRNRC